MKGRRGRTRTGCLPWQGQGGGRWREERPWREYESESESGEEKRGKMKRGEKKGKKEIGPTRLDLFISFFVPSCRAECPRIGRERFTPTPSPLPSSSPTDVIMVRRRAGAVAVLSCWDPFFFFFFFTLALSFCWLGPCMCADLIDCDPLLLCSLPLDRH